MVAKKKNNATTKKVNVKAAKGRSAPAISVNRKEFLSQCVNHIATKIVQAKLPNG
jgi:ethanolamine ammonia-lyase small subunit